ncbi:MAG: EAL domain-containing protein, partial [Cetobacterium sp.]
LKNKNIRISIDDFTAGYSTTGLLATLPIDTVKFDRSLILAMIEDEKKGKAIYVGLIKMMKSLNLKIVSEGIENEKELEFLRENGVDYGQGFYLGKPTKDFYN